MMTTGNPQAFPRTAGQNATSISAPQDGMTLRDWFAGQALPMLCAYGPSGHAPAPIVAAAAYEYADAMLAARQVAA